MRGNDGIMRFAAAAILGLLLTACGGAPHSDRPFRIVQTQDLQTLNPIYVSGVGAQGLAALLFSYLVKIDDRGRLVPDVALAVPTLQNGGISADGLTVTYHLRRGVRFSDGSPLSAKDVAGTIARLAAGDSDAPTRIGFDDIRSVETPSALTVRVRLKRPYAPIVLYVCGPGNAVPILPAHLLPPTHRMANLPFSSAPVGSGPYVVQRWERGDRLELRANPRYFRGKPRIERIDLLFSPTSTTAIQLLRTHEADAYLNADDSQYTTLRAMRLRVDRVPIDGTGALIFNTQDRTLRDPRVRRAFALAINAPALVQRMLLGQRASNPGRGMFGWAYDERAFAMPPYEPQRAAALLTQAGWMPGLDRIRQRSGERLTLDLIVRSDKPSGVELATEIQAYERAAGIDVSIRRFPIASMVAPSGPLYSGNYAVAFFPFIGGFDPDVTDQFACDRIPPRGFNKPRYCNPRLDPIMRQAATTYDISKRAALYRAIQKTLARDLPIDTLYQAVSINAFPAALKGQTTAITTPLWNVAAWHF